MKKPFTVLLLILIIGLSLSACSYNIEYTSFDLYEFGEIYTGNILKAEKDFLNKYIYVEGYNTGIKSEKFWLYADKECDTTKYSHAVCFFDNKDSSITEVLQNVSSGDKIKVYGTIIKIEDSYPNDNIHLQVTKVEIVT